MHTDKSVDLTYELSFGNGLVIYRGGKEMIVFAIDDEPILLQALLDSLKQVFVQESDEIYGFRTASELRKKMQELKGRSIRYAFVDIRLREILGTELAKEIRRVHPETKIIFCTAYTDYAMVAFDAGGVGYLNKPVTKEKIKETVDRLEQMFRFNEQEQKSERKLKIQTFGYFEAYVEEKKLEWKREKSKELLALLVDAKGASLTNSEIAISLWERDGKERNVATILSSLRKTLEQAGVGEVLIKSRNQTSIDTTKISCDMYDFIKGDQKARSAYHGEYMKNYSWAEVTNGSLYLQSTKK